MTRWRPTLDDVTICVHHRIQRNLYLPLTVIQQFNNKTDNNNKSFFRCKRFIMTWFTYAFLPQIICQQNNHLLSCTQHYFSKLNASQTIYFFKPLNWNNYNCAAFVFPWIKCPPNNWTLQWIAFWLWYRAFLLSLFYINYN